MMTAVRNLVEADNERFIEQMSAISGILILFLIKIVSKLSIIVLILLLSYYFDKKYLKCIVHKPMVRQELKWRQRKEARILSAN